MPPTSDVGCYPDATGSIICDLDLSAHAIERFIDPAMDLPEFHDEEGDANATDTNTKASADLTLAYLPDSYVPYSVDDLARRVANFFRFYPPSSTHIRAPSLLEVHSRMNDWQVDVDKVSVQAQAYLTQAIRKFNARQTQHAMDTWFGKDAYYNPADRKELQRILNSVNTMIDNVAYYYDTTCADNVFAFVYPRLGMCSGLLPSPGEKCTLNSEGKFVFYLCPLYMKSDLATQIETLLHEGSHHATAFTTDVCMEEFYPGREKIQYTTVPRSVIGEEKVRGDFVAIPYPEEKRGGTISGYSNTAYGLVWRKNDTHAVIKLSLENDPCRERSAKKAYGQAACADLARLEPSQAMRNADNFCYYISSVVTSKDGLAEIQTYSGYAVGDAVVYAGSAVLGGDADGTLIGQGHQGIVQYPKFQLGQRVEVKSYDAKWELATVTRSVPLMARPDWANSETYPEGFEYSIARPFGEMPLLMVRFSGVGQAVEVSPSLLSRDFAAYTSTTATTTTTTSTGLEPAKKCLSEFMTPPQGKCSSFCTPDNCISKHYLDMCRSCDFCTARFNRLDLDCSWECKESYGPYFNMGANDRCCHFECAGCADCKAVMGF